MGRKQIEAPESNAVIIYMMDVSGSMGFEQKEIVRIEAFWIDTWLKSQYKQLETRVFSSLGKCYENVSFIGGDIVGDMVHAGKKKAPEDSTAEFMVANAFYLPFRKLDAIIDIGGATAYSFFKVTAEKDCETGGFESILCEYHRRLGQNGIVVLDNESCTTPHKSTSTMRLIAAMRPEKFKEMMDGRLDIRGENGYVAKFEVKPLALENGVVACYALKKV